MLLTYLHMLTSYEVHVTRTVTASTSTSYESKAEDFFNIDADTDKEDFDGAVVTLAEK